MREGRLDSSRNFIIKHQWIDDQRVAFPRPDGIAMKLGATSLGMFSRRPM
jgi:hypothetical protein